MKFFLVWVGKCVEFWLFYKFAPDSVFFYCVINALGILVDRLDNKFWFEKMIAPQRCVKKNKENGIVFVTVKNLEGCEGVALRYRGQDYIFLDRYSGSEGVRQHELGHVVHGHTWIGYCVVHSSIQVLTLVFFKVLKCLFQNLQEPEVRVMWGALLLTSFAISFLFGREQVYPCFIWLLYCSIWQTFVLVCQEIQGVLNVDVQSIPKFVAGHKQAVIQTQNLLHPVSLLFDYESWMFLQIWILERKMRMSR